MDQSIATPAHTAVRGLEPDTLHELKPDQLFDRLLAIAHERSATDLFLLCKENHFDVAIRRMGSIETLTVLPVEMGNHLSNFVRAQSGIDLAKKKEPADGRWIYDSEAVALDLRINSIGTLWGEDLAIRLLPKQSNTRKIDDLGFVGDQKSKAMRMANSSGGLILVTGPTGSGKTTTLYALLDYLNNGARKINTIEDPVEYEIPGLCQCQINERRGLDFSTLLKGMVRQSPDVIMIGEIRDEETAHIAVRAANSGHIVLTTVHSPTAATAVQSLVAYDVNPIFLASSLLGVISQRLLRVLSDDSKIRFEAHEAAGAYEEVRRWLSPDEGVALFGPDKDDPNSQGGYSHQHGLFEVMVITAKIREAISRGVPAKELTDIAKQEGMMDFQQAGLINVAKGITSLEEVMRVLPQFE